MSKTASDSHPEVETSQNVIKLVRTDREIKEEPKFFETNFS